MRIGYLTREYALGNVSDGKYKYGENLVGGLGNYLRRLTLALAQAGHEPHVFFLNDHVQGLQIDQGVYIHRINNLPSSWVVRVGHLLQNKFNHTLNHLDSSLRFRSYLNESARQYPLDIIQSTNYGFPALFLPGGVPLIIRCSSYRPLWEKYDHIRSNPDRRLYTKLEALQYRRAAGVFTPTRLLAGILEKELGLRNIAVIRTPFYNEISDLDPGLYEKELDGKDYLLYFGNLSPRKGPQVLAQALSLVWARYPDLRAVFVGRDVKFDKFTRMTEYIKQQCSAHLDKLHILPPLAHSELYPIIANARLVILPSLIDNAPNSLLEAMGFGKPVIGTYGSSMDEFIQDGVSGFLVKPGDANVLAQKICDVLNRSDLNEVGKLARTVIFDFHPDKIIHEMLDFYQSCL